METKAEYLTQLTTPSPHGREYRCLEPCGELIGYVRQAGDWGVLMTLDGNLFVGEGYPVCPKCHIHRKWVRASRSGVDNKPIPAFLDPCRDRKREDIEALKVEARELTKGGIT